MSIYKYLYNAGDKLEDHVRGFLSHYPIVYAFVGGIGVVIFWRGVWHTADYIMGSFTAVNAGISSVDLNLGVWERCSHTLAAIRGICFQFYW